MNHGDYTLSVCWNGGIPDEAPGDFLGEEVVEKVTFLDLFWLGR